MFVSLVCLVAGASCSLILDPLVQRSEVGDADGDGDSDADEDGDTSGDADADVPTEVEADAHCGDGTCDVDETIESCPADCAGTCGDDICSAGEDACSCSIDCESCGEGQWACSDGRCDCSGIVCDGWCHRDAQCCSADDCDDEQGEICSSEHECICEVPTVERCIPVHQDTYVEIWETDLPNDFWDYYRLYTAEIDGLCRIALVQFDLPTIPRCAADELVSASMTLYFENWGGVLGNVDSHQIESGWDEVTILWDDLSYSETATDSVSMPYSPGEPYTWDITSMAQQWISSPSTNHGVALVVSSEDAQYFFYSSNYSDASLHPCLDLEF